MERKVVPVDQAKQVVISFLEPTCLLVSAKTRSFEVINFQRTGV